MKRVAVFDIDGTIFRSSLLIELTEALIQEGLFPTSARKVYARAYRRWLERKGSYEDYIHGVVAAFDRHLKGVSYRKFRSVAAKVVSFHQERVYRYTRDLIRDLRRRGYWLLAISHSPKIAVEPFAKKLGFRKVYGWMYELDQRGRFTGKTLHEDIISDKAKILGRAIEKEGLTLTRSVGVGDTESDIPFLKMVSRPICFNPNEKLYRYAKRAAWEIVVERKDVIYEL